MNYQHGIGPCAYGISVVGWGREPVDVNRGCTATPTVGICTSLNAACTPLLPPTQPGQEDEGPQLLGVSIESRLISFYMLLS